ncbi:rhodanese-like domain-containing protein [Thermus antranikianii]|uniref:rhodanese-like domain-containing protein n=1 Tax=Thermus antranikianii TaxID=88190 RepID=UPI001C770315|nr:rhodanese-like domain-containing protein [Thermus antranikianii]QWK21950.1 MAG: rhodanese-like domain-containing protein [Thermus antranikianii]
MTRRALLGFFALLALVACEPRGSYQNIGPQELYQAVDQGAVVVDVRTPQEFAEGHVPGAINLPVEAIPQWADTLPKDKPVYLYCRSGNRSRQAAEYLKRKGYTNLYNLEGGILAIQREGFPLVR